ncbi:hypothetical protein T492DRAFT_894056 [Pavlovales sp. CCMP2436]|nr:hypothetical protein T492DRAFT_894056 [Pavlovales sp. CCMP2436]
MWLEATDDKDGVLLAAGNFAWNGGSPAPSPSLTKPLAKPLAKPLVKPLAKPLVKPLVKPLAKPLAQSIELAPAPASWLHRPLVAAMVSGTIGIVVGYVVASLGARQAGKQKLLIPVGV